MSSKRQTRSFSRFTGLEIAEKVINQATLGFKPVLSRNEPIHLMTADSCVGVSDFSTIDDNFDNVQWMDSIEVSYNPATNQKAYEARLCTTEIHNIQQRQSHKPSQ